MAKHPGVREHIKTRWFIKNDKDYDFEYVPEAEIQRRIKKGWVLVSSSYMNKSRERWLDKQ